MSKYIFIILSAAIFLIFSYFVFSHSLDAPSYDDYDVTLGFIRNFFFENNTISGKLSALFSNHNEHRIVVSRCFAALYYGIFHHLNFAHLVIFQNAFLIGCISLLWGVMLRSDFPRSTAALLFSVFLVSFSFWQVTFYYWAGIQHYTVMFFSILTLLLLHKADRIGSRPYMLSVMSVLLAVLSFGNGIVAMFLGGFLLWAQKKYKLLVFWSFISIATVILLLIPKNVTGGSTAQINLEWMARLFFTFLGSSLFVNPESQLLRNANIIFCALSGVGVFGFWVWLFISGYARAKPLLYALFSFPVLTAAIISVSRFTTKAAGGIAPRYMFFSAFIPVMVILILWDRRKMKLRHVNRIAFSAVVIWSVSFYNNSRALISYNEEIVSRIDAWEKDHHEQLFFFADVKGYTEIREWALENKVIQGSDTNRNIISEEAQ